RTGHDKCPRLRASSKRWQRRYPGRGNATRRLVMLHEDRPAVRLRGIVGVGLCRGGKAARGLLNEGLLPALALVCCVEGMERFHSARLASESGCRIGPLSAIAVTVSREEMRA